MSGLKDPRTDGKTVDVEKLTRPFPQEAIKQRVIGGGRKADYVDGATVIRRLNEATGFCWDFTVDRYWSEDSKTLALVTLTLPGMGSRQHIGVQSQDNRSGEDAAAKGAITDALKKAATLFGVALDLYGPDYEGGEVAPPQRTQPARTPPAFTQPRPASAPAPYSGPPPPPRSVPDYTAEDFGRLIDTIWEMAEDGVALDQIRDHLNASRHRMTKEMMDEARKAIGAIEAKYYAPASIAG